MWGVSMCDMNMAWHGVAWPSHDAWHWRLAAVRACTVHVLRTAMHATAALSWHGVGQHGVAWHAQLSFAWHGTGKTWQGNANTMPCHAMPCHAMPLLGSVLLRTAASPVACAAGLAALPRGRNAAHLGGDERQLQCTGVHGQVRRMALLAAELLPAIAAASPLPMVLPIAAHQLLRLALLLPGCRLGRRACTTLSGPSAFTSNCGWHGMGWGGVSQSHCRSRCLQ